MCASRIKNNSGGVFCSCYPYNSDNDFPPPDSSQSPCLYDRDWNESSHLSPHMSFLIKIQIKFKMTGDELAYPPPPREKKVLGVKHYSCYCKGQALLILKNSDNLPPRLILVIYSFMRQMGMNQAISFHNHPC